MLSDIIQKDKQYYMNTFGDRLPVMFKSGHGMTLTADNGDEYKDFLGGIAVNALGHSHPTLVNALKKQAEQLVHTSNLYYIENQTLLAEKLALCSCADKIFFANSGAEANEGAFKLAKIYHYKKNSPRYEIISLNKSFHGRTIAAVAATGQQKYQKPYAEFTNGFKQVEMNDFEAFTSAVTDKTAAVVLELIQGESGVHPMDKEYVKKVRQYCTENDIVFIVDEVQTGMGRTGHMFAYQLYDVEPDIFTLAKALGGGVPIGAICAKDKFAAFEPGDHGSTFGGNPFATAAGLAVLKAFGEENLVENAGSMGEYFINKLKALKASYPEKITDVRGAGLLIGVELDTNIASAVFKKLFEKKYLTSLRGSTIRVAPPLIITKSDIDGFINALAEALNEI